jgi:hypothetical protein
VIVAESPAFVLPTPLNMGVGSFVQLPSAGDESVTAGAVVSTSHVSVAGVGSTLPAGSTARTSTVWKSEDSPV